MGGEVDAIQCYDGPILLFTEWNKFGVALSQCMQRNRWMFLGRQLGASLYLVMHIPIEVIATWNPSREVYHNSQEYA